MDDAAFVYLTAYAATVARAAGARGLRGPPRQPASVHALQAIVEAYATALGLPAPAGASDPAAWADAMEAKLPAGAPQTLGRAAGQAWAASDAAIRRDEAGAARGLAEARALLERALQAGDPGIVKDAEILRSHIDTAGAGRVLTPLLDGLADDAEFLGRLVPASPPAPPADAARALARVLADPDDPACTLQQDNQARREFGDAVRAVDPAHAALVRLHLDLRDAAAAARVVINAHGRRLASVRDLVAGWEFRRGFVGRVTLDARAFIGRAADLYRLAPITGLTLTGARGALREVAASPHLARIRVLVLAKQGLGDDDLAALAASPHARNLIELDLAENAITASGVRSLAQAKLPRLATVNLAGTADDPTPVPIADAMGAGMGTELPPSGQSLVDELGEIPWLRERRGGARPDVW